MARISGVDLPPEKRIEFALRYVHGIGPKLALDILKEAQVEIGKKAKDLTEEEVAKGVSAIARAVDQLRPDGKTGRDV